MIRPACKAIVTGLTMVLLLVAGLLYGQGGGHCVVHLDKPFYVNGEVVWYKLYLPPQFAGRERMIEVNVLDDAGEVLETHYRHSAGETFVDGYYKVPFDCRTGLYQLVFSGMRRELGANVLLAQAEVAFYNDFDIIDPALIVASAPGRPAADAALSGDKVQVRVDVSPSISARAEQEIRITLTDAAGQPVTGHVSVSVVDHQMVPEPVLVRGPDMSYGVVEEQMSDNIFVKGVVRDLQGNPIQVNVLGAFSPAENKVQYSKSDKSGIFSLAMPDFYGKKAIQFVGFQQEVDALAAEVIHEVPAQPSTNSVTFTHEIIDYLALSRKRKKIFQYFTALEQNLEIARHEMDRRVFKPDFTYRIAEYEDFDVVRDFFGELITPLKFRQVDTTWVATMENPKGRNIQETHLAGPPLFIVDGKLTRNADFIARMDMSPIETIELFYDPYKLRDYFNAIGRSGVVRITTKLPDAPFPHHDARNIWEINGLLSEAEFPAITAREYDDAPYPLIRSQLYWDPAVTTDGQGVAVIHVPQSDDLTTFRITVLAQAASGARGYGRTTYVVGSR